MPFRNSTPFRLAGFTALLLILAVILYESLQARGQPGVLQLSTNQAYAGHFVIYAVMVFCAMATPGRVTTAGAATVLGFAAGLGVVMELIQAFEPTRTASVADALANAAGALAGMLSFLLAASLLRPLEGRPTKP